VIDGERIVVHKIVKRDNDYSLGPVLGSWDAL
jgi:hypothetical protein